MASLKLKFLLVLILYYKINNSVAHNILDKFSQHSYKVKDTIVKILNYNNSTVNFLKSASFKYNRTITAHNLTANLNVEAGEEVEILVQAYKFLSNEYRHFPVHFQVELCKAVNADVAGIYKSLQLCGNIPAVCYYRKNTTYHLCNIVFDETKLPPNVPSGRYLVEVTATYRKQHLAMLGIYGEIYTPLEHP